MHKLFDLSIYKKDNSLVLRNNGISLFNHLGCFYMSDLSSVKRFAEEVHGLDNVLEIGNKIIYFDRQFRYEVLESGFN